MNPAYVGDDGLGPAYGDPPLSGHDWLSSPQGKASVDNDQKASVLQKEPVQGNADIATDSWPLV